MQDLVDILSAMVARKAAVADARELLLDVGDRIVRRVAGAFGVKADEVAILLLTADRRHLRFVSPRQFAELGSIPVTKRDSIAVNILGKKAGEALNNVPQVRHVAFFESIKLRERPTPIQKMVTVPILNLGESVGVAQVSRKGETPAAAGPDFSSSDVQKLQGVFESLAPYLMQARPDRF
jgi:hypothetical protein